MFSKRMVFSVLIVAVLCSAVLAKDANKPQDLTKELIYQCDFEDANDLADWVMEGPGVAKIEDGKLLIYSEFQPQLYELYKQKKIMQAGKIDYYDELEPLLKAKYPDTADEYYLDGKGLKGGHINYWNKYKHGDNFQLEYEFKSLCPMPLHMVHFSTMGTNGKDIFDKSLKKRNGIAAQYMYGDINTYRISYFSSDRKTANMRKAPGRKLVASGPDIVSLKPDETHKLKVIKWAGTIRFIADDQLVFEYTDSQPFGGGFWGIRIMATAKGQYDNFRVCKLNSKPF